MYLTSTKYKYINIKEAQILLTIIKRSDANFAINVKITIGGF